MGKDNNLVGALSRKALAFSRSENSYNINGEFYVGMRWNISENEWEDRLKIKEEKYCVGMPQSRGYSVWFILPKSSWKYVPQMIKDEIDGNNSPNQLDISESKIQEEIDKLINSTICNE